MRGTSITTRRWGRRLGVLVAVLTFLGAAAIPSLRFLLGRQQTITSPSGINEAGYVRIGGIPQWIDVRGWNRTNPVILWLHGGPGAVVLPASYASFLPWEHEFTLAHWHQRGAGLTYAATPDNGGPLTIDGMANDGIEVAEHLRRRLGAKTIILIGHSWGTVLGTHMAQRRPDLFAAYVGTGQMNSLEDDGKDLFTNAMTRAVAASNTRAIDALTAVDSLLPTDVRRMDAVRTWGRTEDISDNRLLLFVGPLISPRYPVSGTFSLADGFASSRAALFPEELRMRLERDVPELQVPAFLFQGKNDWQVSTAAAIRYFEQLRAPAKHVVLFDGGHFLHVFHSEEFLAELTARVRPLAQ